MALNRLALRELVIFQQGKEVYRQKFHDGVNIIRGKNGSGKSTVLDFIFYVLGGEVKVWKDSAGSCSEVTAEFLVCDAVITLKRQVSVNVSPIKVFYGSLIEASQHASARWYDYPMKRSLSQESFGQIMFRLLNIPEAKSEGGANVTMHQLLRLLYVDQMTPVQRLFRFETFDTAIIRQAVGDILCGVGDLGLYEKQLQQRAIKKQFDDLSSDLSALLKALPDTIHEPNPAAISQEISKKKEQQQTLHSEIEKLTTSTQGHDLSKGDHARRKELAEEVVSLRRMCAALSSEIQTIEYEISDGEAFIQFLDESLDSINESIATNHAVGLIKFKYCPSCFSEIHDGPEGQCFLCKSTLGEGATAARLLEIRTDFEIQKRESSQLLAERRESLSLKRKELRSANRESISKHQEFDAISRTATTSQESILAGLNQKIGFIDGEIQSLHQLQEIVERVSNLSSQKAALQAQLSALDDDIQALSTRQKSRRISAYTSIAELAKKLIKRDIFSDDFEKLESVTFSFEDDVVFVDQKANFSASAMVILKNSFCFSMFLSSLVDAKFWLPRFMLFDNIEDKGMMPERSHNFQKLICEYSQSFASQPHQIIFTTSVIAPELNNDQYTIGPEYLKPPFTLNISHGNI